MAGFVCFIADGIVCSNPTIVCRGREKENLQKTCFLNSKVLRAQGAISRPKGKGYVSQRSWISSFGAMTKGDFGLFPLMEKEACVLCLVKRVK